MVGLLRTSLLMVGLAWVCFPAIATAQVDCTVQPGNIILNCGLDTNLQWWGYVGDSMSWTDAYGDYAAGAALIDASGSSPSFDTILKSTACVYQPSDEYVSGASIRVVSGGSGSTTCRITVFWYLDNCSTLNEADQLTQFQVGSSWVRQFGPSGSVGGDYVQLFVSCSDTVDFTLAFDDMFVASDWVPGDPILVDGFEAGDTSEWSATVGGL